MPDFGDLMKSAASGLSNINKTTGVTGGSLGNIGGVNMGNKGFRTRPQQTLIGAIVGVFVGVGLVLASPFVLWQAESQHTAKDFASAVSVEADSGTDGYVTFQGAPTVAAPLSCVEGEECIYYKVQHQELKTIQEEQCGSTTDDARVLYSTGNVCDDDGTNCEQCYQVERDVWTTITEDEKYTDAVVGAYTVKFNSFALMLGLEETIVSQSDAVRDVGNTFKIPAELLIAGDAVGGTVSSAETTYVLSPYNQGQTLAELEALDATNKWMFRIITFFMLFIGFSSIFGPLSYFGALMRKVPVIGQFMKEGSKLIVGLISFLLALVTFLVLWVVIALVKNILIVVGLLVLGFAVFFFFLKKKE